MSNTITKKKGGRRMMKSLHEWFCVHKSTPDQWFSKWRYFIETLFDELSFVETSRTDLNKPRGKQWEQTFHYRHKHLGDYAITLKRKRKDVGGSVSVEFKVKSVAINTVSNSKYGYDMMSRTDVGNKILEIIRENWAHENSSDEKS